MANDFGCVPDGKALERATTAVGSTTIHTEDGSLRPGDVGKLISIPGAVDLVTVISDLSDRKNASTSSMTAGQKTLTAVFVDHPQDKLERPFDSGDEGKRIFVTGAGLNGAPLVTFVTNRVDRNTLELELPAQSTVDGVLAVLNRPDRAALADYARARPVADTTIVFADRTVTDGQMTVGQAGLRSATAQFSFADLGTPVTVPGAGRLVTMIHNFVSQTEARLLDQAQYAVDNGPADVWTPAPADDSDDLSDSRLGFAELLASLQLDATDIESADIVFGPGVYDFTNIHGGSIELAGLRNLTLRGSGAGATILRLRPDQDLTHDAHVMRLTNCKNVTLCDLTLYGAYLTMGKVNEQMHGLFINEGCEEIVVERVRVFQTAGDGIRLLGAADNNVRKIWIDKCRMIQNKRTGIAFQRNTDFVSVHNCYIQMTPPSTDSCIDLEPTGSIANGHTPSSDITFDSNLLEHGTPAFAVSISGINKDAPAQRVRFTNNVLTGGDIEGAHAQDVTIENNTVSGGTHSSVMRFRGAYDGLRIVGNRIAAPADSASGGIRVSALTLSPSAVRIAGNEIDVPGVGVSLEDAGSSIEVRDNRVHGQRTEIGIKIEVTKSPQPLHRNITIAGNTIVNFGDAGIDLNRGGSADTIEGLEISGNHLVVDAPSSANGLVGIRFQSDRHTPWAGEAVVSGNFIGAGIAESIVRGNGVPYIVTSGNPKGVAIFEGDGPPSGVPGAAGSLYVRLDTMPAELYFKADQATWVRVVTTP